MTVTSNNTQHVSPGTEKPASSDHLLVNYYHLVSSLKPFNSKFLAELFLNSFPYVMRPDLERDLAKLCEHQTGL